MRSFTRITLSSPLTIALTALALTTLSVDLEAQAQKWRKVDKSPLDMSYLKQSRGSAPIARVIYSRPQKRGRAVFKDLVPHGKIWRTGANESTEITFYQDVSLAGKSVKAGSYTLFTIPGPEQWTIILSSKLHQWGAYRHAEADEVLRVTAPATKLAEPLETFSIAFEIKEKQAAMYLGWDDVLVTVPITGAFTK